MLQKKHQNHPLPEGYLFDGVNYVDFIGNRLQYHPQMDQFIEEYLQEQNAEQTKQNRDAAASEKTALRALARF